VLHLRSRLLVLERLGLNSLDAHGCNGMCVCEGGCEQDREGVKMDGSEVDKWKARSA
jgi:hypothetical protein